MSDPHSAAAAAPQHEVSQPDASDPTGLPTTPDALLARFAELGIAAAVHTHPPLRTVEDSKALRGDLPGGHCKNLFLKDRKGRLWLVVALEDTAIEVNRLDAKIGAARLSFGKPDLMFQVLGVRPGAVTPFAAINDTDHQVTVVLERAMLDHATLNYHPLVNTQTVAIASADLLRFLKSTGHEPVIVDLG